MAFPGEAEEELQLTASRKKRWANSNKLKHAMRNFYIMVNDIDTAKHRNRHADHKYGNPPARLAALASLGSQYSLWTIFESDRSLSSASRLLKSLSNLYSTHRKGNEPFGRLFSVGSDAITKTYLEDSRLAAEMLAEAETLPLPADYRSAYTIDDDRTSGQVSRDVSGPSSAREPTDEASRIHGRACGRSIRGGRVLRSRQNAIYTEPSLSPSLPTLAPPCSPLSQPSGPAESTETLTKVELDDQSPAHCSPNGGQRSLSSNVELSPVHIDCVYIETALRRLYGLINTASLTFLEFLGIREESLSAQLAEQPSDRLVLLYATCWGPQWEISQQSLRTTRCFAQSNALIAIISAFVYLEILRNGSYWHIKHTDASNHFVHEVYFKLAFGSQTTLSEARQQVRTVQSEMFANRQIDLAGDASYLGQNLNSIIAPHMERLVTIAISLHPSDATKFRSWEARFNEHFTSLLHDACKLKLDLIKSSICHDFFWPEHSGTFDQRKMAARISPRQEQDLVVAFTTFPGILVDWEEGLGEEVGRRADVTTRDRPR